MVAVPSTRGDFHVSTVNSLLQTQDACHQYGVELEVSFMTGSLVHHARSALAHLFLKGDWSRIFWIDSDIVWEPVAFFKLLVHSLKHDCVVGIYPRRNEGAPGHYMRFAEEGDATLDDDGLVQITGCGLGFACVRRGVIEHLSKLAPKLKHGNPEPIPYLFRQDDDGEEARGEDYAFWADVIEAGYKIYADPSVTLGHFGNKVYRCSWAAK